MEFSRRALLAALGVGGSTGVAACLDFAAGDGPQGPEGEPADLTCSNESFRRLDQPFAEDGLEYTSARTPDGARFELALQGTVETYGHEFRAALRNIDDEDVTIGGREHVAIQRRTAAGWMDVRGTPDGVEPTYPDESTTVGPGDGFIWSLALREGEIADTLSTADLEVCPPLGAGTYRFVYWGLPGEVSIGREFDIVG